MKWIDIDLGRGYIALPKTKSNEAQYVDLNEEAKEILKGFTSWKDSKWVFPSENRGTPMHPTNFYHRVYKPAVTAAKLENVNWHTLRYTFASRLCMSGCTEREIADCLRHRDTSLVKRYAHLTRSHLKGVMEKVSTFGKPKEVETVLKPTVATSEIEVTAAKQSREEALQNVESKGVFGAGEGIRTPDQRLGKPMRYHCATPALWVG